MSAITIGGASGYWGDAAHATEQLLTQSTLDYLVYDYLAEVTLSIMARARSRDATAGYATDFVDVMSRHLADITARGIRVASNAGGMNPLACAEALRAVAAAQQLDLSIAVVEGDDLLARFDQLGLTAELFTGAPLPPQERVLSANAYLGAVPIADAFRRGADVVITGRCVDSAVTLGACLHAFDWRHDDYDRLAQASLAGHLIECGVQVTGGNFTDWRACAQDLDRLGYPLAVIEPTGEFVLTKPAGTGGRVCEGTVAEQLLYEIHDPQRYLLPDVIGDFSDVRLTQTADGVRVTGARGRPPTDTCKVSVTWHDGYRAAMTLGFFGLEVVDKADAFADACLRATARELHRHDLEPLSEVAIDIIGADSQSRSDLEQHDLIHEVQLNLAVRHPARTGVALFIQAVTGLGLATPPGMAIFQSGRPSPSPVVRHFSSLVQKSKLPVRVRLDDDVSDCVWPPRGGDRPGPQRPAPPPVPHADALAEVPLIRLALGRSGDKGDTANIGIIARDPAYLPWLWAALTPAFVRQVFAHFEPSRVERFLLPGTAAINLVLYDVLGGGGTASLRSDAQGKAYAQTLLRQTVPVPKELAESV